MQSLDFIVRCADVHIFHLFHAPFCWQ